jgi:hypothetical protein
MILFDGILLKANQLYGFWRNAGFMQMHYLEIISSFVIRCVVNAASQDFKARIMNSHLLYREMLRIRFFLAF